METLLADQTTPSDKMITPSGDLLYSQPVGGRNVCAVRSLSGDSRCWWKAPTDRWGPPVWRPSAPSSVCPPSGHHRSERRSCDSGRQHVKQRFTYSGFPGCRGARHPGCGAHDSASFAHGPVNRTCSMARNPCRSLAPHILVHVL